MIFGRPQPLYCRGMLLVGGLVACLLALVRAEDQEATSNETSAEIKPQSPASSDTGEGLNQPSTPEDMAALEKGKALYRGLCSGCHGGAGRGGKGPDLTDDRWLHGDKDADIARVIREGVPRTTMKKLGESLKDEQIQKLIAYVRSLGRASGGSTWEPYMSGDPSAGEQLFFDPKGKALCSKCHAVGRRGGRIGPSMDRIAVRRSAEYIMESILHPSKFIDPRYELVQVATIEGKLISGIRVNETNFSIQLREENGRFHSFFKRNLEDYAVQKKSIMPENYAEQLTVKQLHDLFAYLMTLE